MAGRYSTHTKEVVAGIDVGGAKKGFHAVALRGGLYAESFRSREVPEVVAWCHRVGAIAVGVDAPCRWSSTGWPRPAELALMAAGIHCFPTPTLDKAKTHRTNFFGWMLRGAALFEALEETHALLQEARVKRGQRVCFETFPHAIAHGLTGAVQPAKEKRVTRPRLLREAGIDLPGNPGIDFIDAALCALTAQRLLERRVRLYGEAATGFIVSPTNDAGE